MRRRGPAGTGRRGGGPAATLAARHLLAGNWRPASLDFKEKLREKERTSRDKEERRRASCHPGGQTFISWQLEAGQPGFQGEATC